MREKNCYESQIVVFFFSLYFLSLFKIFLLIISHCSGLYAYNY